VFVFLVFLALVPLLFVAVSMLLRLTLVGVALMGGLLLLIGVLGLCLGLLGLLGFGDLLGLLGFGGLLRLLGFSRLLGILLLLLGRLLLGRRFLSSLGFGH
jgi:hypothetical protein